jgi:inhibitor of cysteine peptidase
MLVRSAVTTSVDVLILESFPVQVHVRLTGELGDACTELLPITQTRNGNRVRLTVQSQRPRDAVCAQVLSAFDEVVALEGPFPSGDYVLEVNDVATAFTVKALETALDLNRQRQTMGSMLSFATSNQIMKVDTGRYATELSELEGNYSTGWVQAPRDP